MQTEPSRHVLIWIVGFGTVGQWLVRALDSQAGRLAARYGVRFTVVGLASARDGLIYHQGGLDLPAILRHGSGRTPDTGHPAAGRPAAGRPALADRHRGPAHHRG